MDHQAVADPAARMSLSCAALMVTMFLRPTGGETRRELAVRVRNRVLKIAERHPIGRVAIVSHLGVIEALLPGARVENAGLRRAAGRDLTLK